MRRGKNRRGEKEGQRTEEVVAAAGGVEGAVARLGLGPYITAVSRGGKKKQKEKDAVVT